MSRSCTLSQHEGEHTGKQPDWTGWAILSYILTLCHANEPHCIMKQQGRSKAFAVSTLRVQAMHFPNMLHPGYIPIMGMHAFDRQFHDGCGHYTGEFVKCFTC